MEYSLRHLKLKTMTQQFDVLILILMEYSLRQFAHGLIKFKSKCLNPYSNGI